MTKEVVCQTGAQWAYAPSCDDSFVTTPPTLRAQAYELMASLPAAADVELVEVLTQLRDFWGADPAPITEHVEIVRRPIGKITRSIRPGITFEDEP